MTQTTLIINRVLPIFLLIGLGYWIRRAQFVSEATVEDLRKITVNLALPSVLFLSFLDTELQPNYVILFVVIFAVCVVLMGVGFGLHRRVQTEHPYFPFLMTGFEYGMLGISLFGSAYGLERIGSIAVMDLGHELFIWFVFLALLLTRGGGAQRTSLARAFATSPVVIAIVLALALNLLGVRAQLTEYPVTGALLATLDFLSQLTIPLVLMIVGYGLKFEGSETRDALKVIALRLAIVIPLALVLVPVVIYDVLHLDASFAAGLFTLLILPPPFIIPLYMTPTPTGEKQYVNTVLTLYTVASIAIFATYFVLNPVI